MTPKRGRIPGVTKDSVGWLKSFKISYLDTTGSRQLDKTIKKRTLLRTYSIAIYNEKMKTSNQNRVVRYEK